MSVAASVPAVRVSARVRLRRAAGLVGRVVFAVGLIGFIMAPIVGVLSTSVDTKGFWEFPPSGFSLQQYEIYLSRRELLDSTWVSIGAALVVAVLGTISATAMALALARSRIARGMRDGLGVMLLIPLLVPTIALGLAIYLLYIQAHVPVNLLTLGAAQVILVLPLVTGLLVTGLDGIRPNVERAAANLGASSPRILFRVTMPLLRPAMVAAAIVAFVRSFDDSSVALFINSPDTTTLPIRMLLEMQESAGPLIAACGSILLLIAVVLAFILDRVIGLHRAFGLQDR